MLLFTTLTLCYVSDSHCLDQFKKADEQYFHFVQSKGTRTRVTVTWDFATTQDIKYVRQLRLTE